VSHTENAENTEGLLQKNHAVFSVNSVGSSEAGVRIFLSSFGVPGLACERDSGSCAAPLEMQGRRFRKKVLAHFHGSGAHAFKQPFPLRPLWALA
jgi:hypothetical protein